MISVGIDIGSVCAKAAIYDGNDVKLMIRPTGWNIKETARSIYDDILGENGCDSSEVGYIVATGYGRISIPFADRQVTEITCHAKGAIFLNKAARTIIDIGGQDSKVISIDADGNVRDFIMNDKCAAGTGRFLQVMAHVLNTEVDELDEMAWRGESISINSMCTVFAESEVVSLLASGNSKENIANGVLSSISQKIVHLANRVVINEELFFTGGVSGSEFVRKCLSSKLGTGISSHRDSQWAGAIGAAIIGYEKMK
jgi:(R)-2-hydroxyacyl-CoA dehydratese activating ATPase